MKGHLDALLHAVLARGPLHGYAVIEELGRRSDGLLFGAAFVDSPAAPFES